VTSKIVVDVHEEVKQKLSDIAHAERGSMKSVIVRLVDQEYKKIKRNAKK